MKVGIGVLVIILLIVGVMLFNKPQSQNTPIQNTSTPSPTSESVQETNITASFTIITDNLTRNFSSEKYHNKSLDVFIESSDPSVIHVKKPGITWDGFFKTLPMKLTKDCLVTGDGESLCNTNGILKFYLNDTEDPNLLEKEIKQNDKALIKFTST